MIKKTSSTNKQTEDTWSW